MIRRRLILVVAFLATFALGWVAARSWHAPVAGTLPDEIPRELLTRMQVRKSLVLSEVPADELIARIGREWDVPTVLEQTDLHMDVTRPIDLKVADGTFIDAVTALKFNYDLDATVTGGVVRFGSQARIRSLRVLRVYQIGDLVDRVIERGIADDESEASRWIASRVGPHWFDPDVGRRILWQNATAFEHQKCVEDLNALANSPELTR